MIPLDGRIILWQIEHHYSVGRNSLINCPLIIPIFFDQ
ncbi:hypothetical protein V22_21690 [Calycomorphotria hydatis]|uniref:Uncharacterized protein n=1 Tax=Calycomorphotria hydatis TaxID=2528027 RepID=A0A517T962_9PLAN|nr:hypothetical protein V22_21690 [Calycomorphotria hydatis]